MPDQEPKDATRPATAENRATSTPPVETEGNTSASDKQSKVSKLTAEEQMALFEKDLKENDWGHQPC